MKRDARPPNLPTAEILLSVLNEEPEAANKILQFYTPYIYGAAKRSVEETEIEDLVQEIQLSVARCLPLLRTELIRSHLNDKPLVVVIQPK